MRLIFCSHALHPALTSVPPDLLPAPQAVPSQNVRGHSGRRGGLASRGTEEPTVTTDPAPPTEKGTWMPTGSAWHSVSWLVAEPRAGSSTGGPHATEGSPLCCCHHLSPARGQRLIPGLPLLHPPYGRLTRAFCGNAGRPQASSAQPPPPEVPTLRGPQVLGHWQVSQAALTVCSRPPLSPSESAPTSLAH